MLLREGGCGGDMGLEPGFGKQEGNRNLPCEGETVGAMC